MKPWQLSGLIGILLIVVLVASFSWFIMIEKAEMEGFCEDKGYDGYQGIDGEFCCYRWQDDNLVAVPISVLKGE